MKNKMIEIDLGLNEKQWQELKECAALNQESVDQFCQRAVQKYIDKLKDRRRRAKLKGR